MRAGGRRWRRRRFGVNGGVGWKTRTAAWRETRDMAGDGGMEGRWRDGGTMEGWRDEETTRRMYGRRLNLWRGLCSRRCERKGKGKNKGNDTFREHRVSSGWVDTPELWGEVRSQFEGMRKGCMRRRTRHRVSVIHMERGSRTALEILSEHGQDDRRLSMNDDGTHLDDFVSRHTLVATRLRFDVVDYREVEVRNPRRVLAIRRPSYILGEEDHSAAGV
jgi:hypothetical protein